MADNRLIPGIHYRALGRTDFVFDFREKADGAWRIYIVSHPPYGRRDTSLHSTHRLRDGRRFYVCWSDPLRDLDSAKQVAALWAECTQEYVRTGSFEPPADRPEISERPGIWTAQVAVGDAPHPVLPPADTTANDASDGSFLNFLARMVRNALNH